MPIGNTTSQTDKQSHRKDIESIRILHESARRNMMVNDLMMSSAADRNLFTSFNALPNDIDDDEALLLCAIRSTRLNTLSAIICDYDGEDEAFKYRPNGIESLVREAACEAAKTIFNIPLLVYEFADVFTKVETAGGETHASAYSEDDISVGKKHGFRCFIAELNDMHYEARIWLEDLGISANDAGDDTVITMATDDFMRRIYLGSLLRYTPYERYIDRLSDSDKKYDDLLAWMLQSERMDNEHVVRPTRSQLQTVYKDCALTAFNILDEYMMMRNEIAIDIASGYKLLGVDAYKGIIDRMISHIATDMHRRI